MFHLSLWAVFLVWGVLGFALFAILLATLSGSALRMIADHRGRAATIWCPVFRREYRVIGTPTGFRRQAFDDVRRCERFGKGRVRCGKTCLKVEELAAAASTN